ncbi:hypothetical protein ACT691_06475 [Vibrio metschnikovii]
MIAFQATDNLRFAAALEANLTADKADAANDYLGYGATVNYSVQDFSLDLSYAYRDFDVTGTKEDTSIGAVIQYNALWFRPYLFTSRHWQQRENEYDLGIL